MEIVFANEQNSKINVFSSYTILGTDLLAKVFGGL